MQNKITLLVRLRSALFEIGYFFVTVSYGVFSLLTWLLPAMLRHRIIASWTTVMVYWLKISCGIDFRVKGKENLDGLTRPVVVLSKHQSSWETLYMQTLFWPASTVLKRELLNIPFFGWGLRALQPIAINRDNPRQALKQVKTEGLKRLDRHLNLILFPEGTRMAPGEKGVYARSGADIAKASGKVIIPVALNSANCWPAKTIYKFPGLITVSIGPAIETQDKTNKEIMLAVEAWIEHEMLTLDD